MLDKLLAEIIERALDEAAGTETRAAAAEEIRAGTDAHGPVGFHDDLGVVTAVTTSPCGSYAFVGNADGQLCVVDVATSRDRGGGGVILRSDVHPGKALTAIDVTFVHPPGEGEDAATAAAAAASGGGGGGAGKDFAVADEDDEDDPAETALDLAALAAVRGPDDPPPPPACVIATACRDGCGVFTMDLASPNQGANLLGVGDTPLTAEEDDDASTAGRRTVRGVTLSPDARTLVVRCAGGGFGVFSVPPLSLEDWPKPEVGGDASAAIDGDAAAAAAAAAEEEGEGEAGEETPAEGEGEGEAPEGTKEEEKSVAMTRLAWVPASVAAETLGEARYVPPAARASPEKTDADGGAAAAGDEDPAAAPEAADPEPEGDGDGDGDGGGDAATREASDGIEDEPTTAPTTHFRLARASAADAVYVTWPGHNRVMMYQLGGARNIAPRFTRAPSLRAPNPVADANGDGDGDGDGDGGDAEPSPSAETEEGEEGGGGEDVAPPPPVAVTESFPACDWTTPFPVSSSCANDEGTLLAVGLTDGSVMLFNMRLGAVGRTLERLSALDGELDDDASTVCSRGPGRRRHEATAPVGCVALSFWGDAPGPSPVVAAASTRGWIALFPTERAAAGARPPPPPTALRQRNGAVLAETLTCQKGDGSLAFVAGLAPPKPARDPWDSEEENDEEEKEEEATRASDEATHGASLRLVDLTARSDVSQVIEPPEGYAFARGEDGKVMLHYRGGVVACVGVRKLPPPEPEPVAEAFAAPASEAEAPTDGDGGDAPAADGEEGATDAPPADAPPADAAEDVDDGEAAAEGEDADADADAPAEEEPPRDRVAAADAIAIYELPVKAWVNAHNATKTSTKSKGALKKEPSSRLTAEPSFVSVNSAVKAARPPLRQEASVMTSVTWMEEPSRARTAAGVLAHQASFREPSYAPKLAPSHGGDLATTNALKPVDAVAACLERLTSQRGGKAARAKRMTRRHREMEARLSSEREEYGRAPQPPASEPSGWRVNFRKGPLSEKPQKSINLL